MTRGLSMARLIMREMQRAKINTALCFAVVLLATGLLIGMVSVTRASVNATRVMMKRMGFNLLITPEGVDVAQYQALNFQDKDMPEEYVQRLAENGTILAQHFVGKYQKTVQLDGNVAVLTGVLAEVPRAGTRKTPMPTAYDVPRGTVYLGAALAPALGVAAGDSVDILGKRFPVGRVLDEVGAPPEDIRIFAHLHDVQELVGRPGRINAVDALACHCQGVVDDVITALQKSITETLPDVDVRPYQSILLARQKQRLFISRLELIALAIVMAGSATAIWGLTYQNVHNRRQEIGVLRALGVADWRIALIFLGKTLVYSLAGAAAGCALGYTVAAHASIIEFPVSPPKALAVTLLFVTPLIAAAFGLPPVLGGLLHDPADVIQDGT